MNVFRKRKLRKLLKSLGVSPAGFHTFRISMYRFLMSPALHNRVKQRFAALRCQGYYPALFAAEFDQQRYNARLYWGFRMGPDPLQVIWPRSISRLRKLRQNPL